MGCSITLGVSGWTTIFKFVNEHGISQEIFLIKFHV